MQNQEMKKMSRRDKQRKDQRVERQHTAEVVLHHTTHLQTKNVVLKKRKPNLRKEETIKPSQNKIQISQRELLALNKNDKSYIETIIIGINQSKVSTIITK